MATESVNAKAKEKRQRFHEALLQMLYPPPPPHQDNQKSLGIVTECPDLDRFPDELKGDGGSPSSSSSDDGKGESDVPKKHTRAQRKKLRKKKLTEAASRRRKVIGPTIPGWKDDAAVEANGDVAERGPPSVRQNAAYVPDIGAKNPEEAPSCSKRAKQKHRRMAKKLASERLKFSSTENQGSDLSKKGTMVNMA